MNELFLLLRLCSQVPSLNTEFSAEFVFLLSFFPSTSQFFSRLPLSSLWFLRCLWINFLIWGLEKAKERCDPPIHDGPLIVKGDNLVCSVGEELEDPDPVEEKTLGSSSSV